MVSSNNTTNDYDMNELSLKVKLCTHSPKTYINGIPSTVKPRLTVVPDTIHDLDFHQHMSLYYMFNDLR